MTIGVAALVVGALVVSDAAATASLGGGSDLQLPLLRLFLGLVLCSLIALLAVIALRRAKSGAGPLLPINLLGIAKERPTQPAVRVRETHRLSPHAEMMRLSWAASEYLVVVTTSAVSVIDKRPSETAQQ